MTGGNRLPFVPVVSDHCQPILAKNISEQTIPRFACVQAVGTVIQNDQCYLEIDQPRDSDGLNGPYFFNLHYDCGYYPSSTAYTTVTAGPIVNAIGDTSLAAGTKVRPQTGSWEVESCDVGRWIVIGENAGAKLGGDVLKLRQDDAVIHSMIFLTPSGGIAARSGTTPGSATCTGYVIDNGSLTTFKDTSGSDYTATVYNISTTAATGSTYIQAKRSGCQWVADFEDC